MPRPRFDASQEASRARSQSTDYDDEAGNPALSPLASVSATSRARSNHNEYSNNGAPETDDFDNDLRGKLRRRSATFGSQETRALSSREDEDLSFDDDGDWEDFSHEEFARPITRRPSRLRENSLRDAAQRASGSSNSSARRSATLSTRSSDSAPKSAPRRSKNHAKNETKYRVSARAKQPPRALWYEVGGVLLLALSLLLLWNARHETEQIHGALPHLVIGVLRNLFGVGAIVIPLLGILLGATMIAKHHHTNLRAFGRGALVAFLVLLTTSHLFVARGREFLEPERSSHGGLLGAALSRLLRVAVGPGGAIIFLIALSLVALLLWSELSLAQSLSRLKNLSRNFEIALRSRFEKGRARRYESEDDGEQHDSDWSDPKTAVPGARALRSANIEYSNSENAPRKSPFLSVDELLEPTETPTFAPSLSTLQSEAAAETKPDELTPKIEFTDAPPPVSVLNPVLEPLTSVIETPLEVAPKGEDEMTPTEKLEAQALASATEGEAPIRRLRIEKPRRRFGDGPLMPEYFDDAVRALDPPIIPDLEGAEDDIHAGVKAVTETLASFKIDARVTDVKRGPVITRYEVQPAPGVRVATIAALDRDMSRALSAIAVRIEAPVPGKDVIGIEVPNKKVNLVRLRDVLERHEFLSTQSKLSFVLGKDIAGQPKWADLTKMPHMLVAGATNSGKSVCLNSIIASILVRATPEEVKFSLIDPKRVELTLFNGIKHLYHPVVVEPKDAVKVLRGMISEMDRRYKSFAERGVRNIVSYNSKLEEGEAPLPYIVIVIDELADLMMTAAAEFEKLICRLAQLARATGIHLIVATQRPSVNVITGVIKANIPSRIAFAVASQVDSRTILDSMGAERLIGSGDMLFDANNGGKAIRIQGAYLSEEEVNRVVDVVKAAYADDETPMEYGMDISAVTEDDVNEANEKTVARSEKKDELYDEILEYVVRNTEMSASMIQRKFEIGYPRAARIVDQFERDGVLSPPNGSKPRKVVGNGRGVEMN